MKEGNGLGDVLDPVDFDASCKMRKHSVSIAGHRTSVSLEDAFWDELRRIATSRGQTVSAIVEEIDRRRSHNLSGSLRVFVLHAMDKDAAA